MHTARRHWTHAVPKVAVGVAAGTPRSQVPVALGEVDGAALPSPHLWHNAGACAVTPAGAGHLKLGEGPCAGG